jgi:hypothetical protein
MVKCKATQKLHIGDMPNNPQTGGLFSLSIVSCEHGTFRPQRINAGHQRHHRTAGLEERMLHTVEMLPNISTRHTASMVGISHYECMEDFMRAAAPSISLPVSASITTSNAPLRQHFCRWLLRQLASDPLFTTCMLFTDEACFTRSGILNVHNACTWTDEHP